VSENYAEAVTALDAEIMSGLLLPPPAPPRPPPADNWCKNDREEFAKLNALLAQIRGAAREAPPDA
jgi:hypothetical protein